MKTVKVNFHPEWRGLLAAKLTSRTPSAKGKEDEIEDDDPTPYREDFRCDFNPWPNRRLRTHYVILALESDDERYRLFVLAQELPDETLHVPKEVYRKELHKLEPQEVQIEIDNCPVRVVIGEIKTVC